MAGVPSTPNPIKPGAMVPSAEAAKRIAMAVRRVEESWRNRPPSKVGGPSFCMLPSAWMKTTSAITARSGSIYGTGTARIQSDSGTALVDDGISVTLKNGTDKRIASGSYVMAFWALNHWWAGVPGSCTNLSTDTTTYLAGDYAPVVKGAHLEMIRSGRPGYQTQTVEPVGLIAELDPP